MSLPSRRLRALVATVACLGLSACGAAPKPSDQRVPSAEPPPSASSPMAMSSEAAPAAAPSASPAAAPAPSSAATSEPPKDKGPPPLTPDEQKKLEKTCKPLVAALQRATQKSKGVSPLDVLATLMKSPPKMPAPDLATCSSLLERSIRDYLAAAIEIEAQVTLKRIAKGMIGAYADTHALCPATSAAVPAKTDAVAGGPYESTSADWSAPTWKCLNFDMSGERQRFQYEVRTDPSGKWFEAIARGAPRGDGRIVEIVQRGEIKADKIELPPLVHR